MIHNSMFLGLQAQRKRPGDRHPNLHPRGTVPEIYAKFLHIQYTYVSKLAYEFRFRSPRVAISDHYSES